MKWTDRWYVAIPLITGLMVGFAFSLWLLVTMLVDRWTNHHSYPNLTVWALLVGIVLGLYLGIRYHERRWLTRLEIALTMLSVAFYIFLMVPYTEPEQVQNAYKDFLQSLGYDLGEAIRKGLIGLMSLLFVVCFTISAALWPDCSERLRQQKNGTA